MNILLDYNEWAQRNRDRLYENANMSMKPMDQNSLQNSDQAEKQAKIDAYSIFNRTIYSNFYARIKHFFGS